jgi:hypothetical protein
LFSRIEVGESKVRAISSAAITFLGIALLCSGCGTRTPDMTLSADPHATENKLNDVIGRIKAELECAVFRLNEKYGKYPELSWIKTGTGKATIMLTADEKSIFNPTAIYTDNLPTITQTFLNKSVVTTTRNFGLAGGINASSDATRVIQVDYSFDFARDFFSDPKAEVPQNIDLICSHPPGLYIDSDLKVADSFDAILWPYAERPNKNNIDSPYFIKGTSSTMQTHITFIVAATGNITPAWKLVPVSFNLSSNPFFQTGRTQTDDVIITIGPKAKEVATAHDITKIGIQNNIFINH